MSWHPSAASGEAHRVVLVGIKTVDRVAVRAGEYAERIPAAARRGLHAATGVVGDVTMAWSAAMPEMPLEVVPGDDVVAAIEGAVRAQLSAPDVSEVVVVLARRRSTCSTGATLRRLVTALRRIDRVAPIVLPPPPA